MPAARERGERVGGGEDDLEGMEMGMEVEVEGEDGGAFRAAGRRRFLLGCC